MYLYYMVLSPIPQSVFDLVTTSRQPIPPETHCPRPSTLVDITSVGVTQSIADASTSLVYCHSDTVVNSAVVALQNKESINPPSIIQGPPSLLIPHGSASGHSPSIGVFSHLFPFSCCSYCLSKS